MENSNHPRQPTSAVSGPPPFYDSQGYEPLKGQIMEFQNVSGQQVPSTVVEISSNDPPIRDHLVWSIFNISYMNFCCLGLLALVFSVKSRDRKLLGDKSGARSYGSTSFALNIATTVLTILFFLILFILLITGVISVVNNTATQYGKYENKPFVIKNPYSGN